MNADVFLLTCMFTIQLAFLIFLTHVFNPLTCAFYLPTRAFDLATRAFSLPTREMELISRAFELVTGGFELVTGLSELVTRLFYFPQQNDLPTRALFHKRIPHSKSTFALACCVYTAVVC